MKLEEAVKRIQAFEKHSLTNKIKHLEREFIGCDKLSSSNKSKINNIDRKLLVAVQTLKKAAGQINVVMHATGILVLLRHILEDNEEIEKLSLGAGNTGKKFDLETNLRIAEFKFINWRGGSETIRQNSIFKDFFYLAEEKTSRQKYLYVLGTEKPLKFLTGNRKLTSVMSKNVKLAEDFKKRYGTKYIVVSEYYNLKKSAVHVTDISDQLFSF